MKNAKNWMIGFLAGSFIGGVAALLTAPDSGENTRTQIAGRVDEMTNQATTAYQDNRSKMESKIDQLVQETRQRTDKLMDIGREMIADQQKILQHTADRARQEVLQPEPEA